MCECVCVRVVAHHLLCDDLRNLLLQVKGELDGSALLVFAFQLLVVFHPEFQGDGGLLPVVLLGELHPHARVLGEEGVIQQVLDAVPGAGGKKNKQTQKEVGLTHKC